jgi:hypothetical protein
MFNSDWLVNSDNYDKNTVELGQINMCEVPFDIVYRYIMMTLLPIPFEYMQVLFKAKAFYQHFTKKKRSVFSG